MYASNRGELFVPAMDTAAFPPGYRLRAVGKGHNWSPLVLAPGESASNIVLVNLQDSLTSISIDASASRSRSRFAPAPR